MEQGPGGAEASPGLSAALAPPVRSRACNTADKIVDNVVWLVLGSTGTHSGRARCRKKQCGEGDVLVVTTTSPSTDGMFGELFATALQQRGVRGLIINAGVRDTQELREMDFPAWSRAVSAQGTVKATGGSVNVPVAIDGQVIRPGDVILADDDGVVVVPRERARATVEASEAREAKEAKSRAAFLDGELGLDRYGLRETLKKLGVEYRTYEEYTAGEPS
ncbi:hypothetical protein SAURM35S_02761 [Streptomyces aurantiogriseus]